MIGTIFRLSGTKTVEMVVRAGAPGMPLLGWSSTSSATCDETTKCRGFWGNSASPQPL